MSRTNEQIASDAAAKLTSAPYAQINESIILAALNESNAQRDAENARLRGGVVHLETKCLVASKEIDHLRAALDGARGALADREKDIADLCESVKELQAENARMQEVHLHGCDCSPSDACKFAGERDDLRTIVATAREALEHIQEQAEGALNNAFPEDAPEIVEDLGVKAKQALARIDEVMGGQPSGGAAKPTAP